MDKCKYNGYYPCKNDIIKDSDFCAKHAEKKCRVCGNQATKECEYCGQFVCGVPLCDNCEGYEKKSDDPGVWGFLNHTHRRKNSK